MVSTTDDGNPLPGPEKTPPRLERLSLRVLQGAIAYFLLAMLTLPAAGTLWIGPASTPVPVLALVQLPKTAAVQPIRHRLAMHYAKSDASRSYSPHYGRARVPALVLGYALVVGGLSLLCLTGARFSSKAALLVVLLIGVAAIDGCVTLRFGSPRPPGALSTY